MIDTNSNQAVVLGASIAGLLAARVLSERFERVVVIERDVLPPAGKHRRGVPHGRHLHGLHPRGREILEELFPGFTASLVASGAVRGDVLGNVRWQLSGHQLRQAQIGLPGLLASRPFLEGHVRAMVQSLPGVRFLEDCSVCGLTTAEDKQTITGVQVRGPDGGPPAQVTGSLVVDATGRGSRTPVWLAELGYQPPEQERVEIGLGYATRTYRLRPGAIRPSTSGDGPMPSGNKAMTSRKNSNTASVSAPWRSESRSSRLKTAAKHRSPLGSVGDRDSIDMTTPSDQAQFRRARQWQRQMRGGDHQTAAASVPLQHRAELFHRSRVEPQRRLVQQPQRYGRHDQPRQSQAPLLPGRQHPCRKVGRARSDPAPQAPARPSRHSAVRRRPDFRPRSAPASRRPYARHGPAAVRAAADHPTHPARSSAASRRPEAPGRPTAAAT